MTVFRGRGAIAPKPNGSAPCCRYGCRRRLRGVCRPSREGGWLRDCLAEVFTEDGLSTGGRRMQQMNIYENAKW